MYEKRTYQKEIYKVYKKAWKYWLFLVLLAWLSGCQTSGGGSVSGRSAGIDSLSQIQAGRYQQALDRLEQKEPQSAERLLQDLVRERRDVAELWVNLALSQYQQAKWQAAEATIDQTLSLFSRIPQAYNLAGLLAVKKGEFKQAEQHYLQAIGIDNAYANALFNMALLQDVYLRNVASAVDYYNRYLGYAPDDEATKAWVDNLSQSLAR